MNEDFYVEKLRWFKANEKPEAVLAVAECPVCIRMAVAWTTMEVHRAEKLTRLKGESESAVWDWLWRNATYSLAEFTDRIGIPYSQSALESRMRPLISNRVLYPDGTVNSSVQRYLREQVLRLFDAKPSRPWRKDRTGSG
ncbi:MAG: hypothetical protein ACYC5O_15465 [Anaerolineae bacterium]